VGRFSETQLLVHSNLQQLHSCQATMVVMHRVFCCS